MPRDYLARILKANVYDAAEETPLQPAPNLSPNSLMMDSFPNVPQDNQCNSITVFDLLTHQGGWDRNISPDQMFQDTAVATLDWPRTPSLSRVCESG